MIITIKNFRITLGDSTVEVSRQPKRTTAACSLAENMIFGYLGRVEVHSQLPRILEFDALL